MRRNSSCATISSSLFAQLDGLQPGLVAVGLGHLEQLGVVRQVAGQVVDGLDHVLERALLAPQLLRALGLVPDLGVLERGVDFVES
jgi:hypothetical protein